MSSTQPTSRRCLLVLALFVLSQFVVGNSIDNAIVNATSHSHVLQRRGGMLSKPFWVKHSIGPNEIPDSETCYLIYFRNRQDMEASPQYKSVQQREGAPMSIVFYPGEDTAFGVWIQFPSNKELGGQDAAWVNLEPGRTHAILGNIPGPQELALQAYPGCLETNWPCQMDGEVTKLEWCYGCHNGDTHINLSNIDGYNTRLKVTFGPKSDCPKDLEASVSDQNLHNKCPSRHQFTITHEDGKSHPLCRSDCKMARAGQWPDLTQRLDEFCCLEQYDTNKGLYCPPSNQHLDTWLKHKSFLYPGDQMRASCRIKNMMNVEIGGGH